MPGVGDSDFEPQDGAETFDETHTSEAAEMRTFEEMDEVLDVTREEGDADDEDDPSDVVVVRLAKDDPDPEETDGSGASADDIDDERDPHTEKKLDEGLKETFPASDPVSISPGSD